MVKRTTVSDKQAENISIYDKVKLEFEDSLLVTS